MFPYSGSKSRIAHLYPPPKQRRVFEPFAGSARYSLLYPDNDVWINDIDPLIVAIWRYLQQATINDIKALPELRAGEDLRDFKSLSDVERNLLGFAINFGKQSPSHTCSPICGRENRCGLLKARILSHLSRIRHWKITCLSYSDLPDVSGTWFVDPPYQQGKLRYRYHCVVDYQGLAKWCKRRQGRVIVCEGNGADWLPFRPFTVQLTQRDGHFQEMAWIRD